MFFFLVILVGTTASLFTAYSLHSKSASITRRAWIFFTVLFFWVSPFLLRGLIRGEWLNPAVAGWFNNIGYYLFGTAFFLFSVLLMRNVVWYGAYGVCRLLKRPFAQRIDPDRPELRNSVNRATLCVALLISFYAVYEGTKLAEVKEIVLKTDKVSRPFTFVLLNDIHIHRGVSVQKIEKLIERVNALRPDAVLLAGDIGDDESDEATLIARRFDKLTAPAGVFAVMGNHELYNDFKKWDNVFKNSGIRVLKNGGTAVGGRTDVYIGGVTDASFRRVKNMAPDIARAMYGSVSRQFRILMSHSPLPNGKDSPDQSELFDLQVSGHTHGGQIFPFHFLVKPVNRYLAGLYDLETPGAKIYVSRGTGYWGPPMRLFAPSEITLFRILPSDAQSDTDDQGNG